MSDEKSDKVTTKDWIPFFTALVTPFFVLLLIFWFHGDVKDFLGIVKKAVGEEGRGVKVGDWLELGERAKATEIAKLGFGDISVSLPEGIQAEWIVDKGSMMLLEDLRRQSQKLGGRPVDAMVVKKGIIYAPRALEQYISRLGVRFVLYTRNGQFEHWVPAGLFVGQLNPERTYTYEELRNEIIGLRDEAALPTSKASEVLDLMQKEKTDYVAIVNKSGKYQYMVSKSDILTKLVAGMILEEKPIEGEEEG